MANTSIVDIHGKPFRLDLEGQQTETSQSWPSCGTIILIIPPVA